MPEEVQANPAIQIDPKKEAVEATVTKEDTAAAPAAVAPNVDGEIILNDDSWEMVLNTVKQKHNTLYSVAKMAQPHFEPGHITLEFSYSFHQKRLNDTRNKEILSGIIGNVTGSQVQVSCIVGEGKGLVRPSAAPLLPAANGEVVHHVANKPVSDKPQSESVETISNIFGGAELLES
jgi:hypothetical protein